MREQLQWLTVNELQHGMEQLLLSSDRSLQQLCEHAQAHGVEWATTIRHVNALRAAGRLETLPGPGLRYQLSDWNRAQIEGQQFGHGVRL
jgi:hypothetical protein